MPYLTEQAADPGLWPDDHADWEHTVAGAQRPRDKAAERLADLARAIESQIVPRLVLARRAARVGTEPPEQSAPGAEHVARLTQLILEQNEHAAAAHVQALRARGTALETIFLQLLAPTARRLGRLWETDHCDFTQVTLGLWQLQQLLRSLSPGFMEGAAGRGHGLRALLVPVPGEQHIFGVSMVAEFFRRMGWDVWSAPLASSEDLRDLVRSEWFAMVGFSAGSERRLDDVSASIRAVRRASCNREIGVMVGGPLFREDPELVSRVGADATAVDARQAALQAQDLLLLLTRRT
jgi:methanogenic corrinoid protein MtbC1